MTPTPQVIPFCRSEFLQDFTIDLGLRLETVRRGVSFVAEADTCEHEGEELERLMIWVETIYLTRVNLTLWEDRTMWVNVTLLPAENYDRYSEGFYPDPDLLTSAERVEALIATVSVSTRLCYQESTLPLLRKFWKYSGEAEISGTLELRSNVSASAKRIA